MYRHQKPFTFFCQTLTLKMFVCYKKKFFRHSVEIALVLKRLGIFFISNFNSIFICFKNWTYTLTEVNTIKILIKRFENKYITYSFLFH